MAPDFTFVTSQSRQVTSRTARLAALVAILFLSGCAEHVGFHSSHLGFHGHPEYAQPSMIPCFGTSAFRYTIYYGSDAKWHYFETLRDLKLERYQVPRFALDWRPVFPVRTSKVYVGRNVRGELVPISKARRPR